MTKKTSTPMNPPRGQPKTWSIITNTTATIRSPWMSRRRAGTCRRRARLCSGRRTARTVSASCVPVTMRRLTTALSVRWVCRSNCELIQLERLSAPNPMYFEHEAGSAFMIRFPSGRHPDAPPNEPPLPIDTIASGRSTKWVFPYGYANLLLGARPGWILESRISSAPNAPTTTPTS
jgi:hypothetical protein